MNRDVEELWRRMVFNILIKNVDDHLHNHGFLNTKHGQWELAPAFDINPFPNKQHVLKLWISESSGLSAHIEDPLDAVKRFGIKEGRAVEILSEVLEGTRNWRHHASLVGLKKSDIEYLSDAFIHDQRKEANKFVATKMSVPENFKQSERFNRRGNIPIG